MLIVVGFFFTPNAFFIVFGQYRPLLRNDWTCRRELLSEFDSSHINMMDPELRFLEVRRQYALIYRNRSAEVLMEGVVTSFLHSRRFNGEEWHVCFIVRSQV